jgi:hypothetical protein
VLKCEAKKPSKDVKLDPKPKSFRPKRDSAVAAELRVEEHAQEYFFKLFTDSSIIFKLLIMFCSSVERTDFTDNLFLSRKN